MKEKIIDFRCVFDYLISFCLFTPLLLGKSIKWVVNVAMFYF